jgi:hypothetical protein
MIFGVSRQHPFGAGHDHLHNFVVDERHCSVGVIGSSRMNYAYVFAMLEYLHKMITNVIP